jgi:hypothetical protein
MREVRQGEHGMDTEEYKRKRESGLRKIEQNI